jgi:succinate dehydrogenase flavin-adding protein (antitoxin of CptAB toxin-antitoxin module)
MIDIDRNQDRGHEPPRSRQEALDRMEQLLAEQLSAASGEDYDRITALARPLADLLDWVANSPQPAAAEETGQVQRIQDLRRRIKLTLAEQRRETGEKIRHVGRGHGSLKAYRQNTWRTR